MLNNYKGIKTLGEKKIPYQSMGQRRGDATVDAGFMDDNKKRYDHNPDGCIGTMDEKFYILDTGDALMVRQGYNTGPYRKPLVVHAINAAKLTDYPAVMDAYRSHSFYAVNLYEQPFLTDKELAPIVGGDVQVTFYGDAYVNDNVAVVLSPIYEDKSKMIGIDAAWKKLIIRDAWDKSIFGTSKIGWIFVPYDELVNVYKQKIKSVNGKECKDVLDKLEKQATTLGLSIPDLTGYSVYQKLVYLLAMVPFSPADPKITSVLHCVGSTLVKQTSAKVTMEMINLVDDKTKSNGLKDLLNRGQYDSYARSYRTAWAGETKMLNLPVDKFIPKYVENSVRIAKFWEPYRVGRLLQDSVGISWSKVKLKE